MSRNSKILFRETRTLFSSKLLLRTRRFKQAFSDIPSYGKLIHLSLISSIHQDHPQDKHKSPNNDVKYPTDKWYKAEDDLNYCKCTESHYGLHSMETDELIFLFEDKEDDAGYPPNKVTE